MINDCSDGYRESEINQCLRMKSIETPYLRIAMTKYKRAYFN